MRKFAFWFLLLTASISFSQSLSDYKYVLIPDAFSFQKEVHQYNLNRLTQFLLNKYNFEAYIQGEENLELENVNACEILNLRDEMKGGLTSKLKFNFLDCKGKLIYTTKEGVSRKKDFKGSYEEALRNVFNNDKIIRLHEYYGKYKPEEPIVKTNVIKEASKIKVETLQFELRGKKYSFIPITKESYSISKDSKEIGKAIQISNSSNYKIEAGTLSGTGYFDDFGNFILKRINPANQKELTDTMIRVK